MTTSPEERFKNIFATAAKPALPDLSQPHLAETELQRSKQVYEMQYQIPEVLQAPHNPIQLDHSTARDIISGSEDDDDYVNAFKSSLRPSMLTPKHRKVGGDRKSRKAAAQNLGTPSRTTWEVSHDETESVSPVFIPPASDQAHLVDSNNMDAALNLPNEDGNGNKVTGHFCVFSLTAKFPYKYMRDPNDKVSKRFFANNKFYSREWDVYYVHPPESMYSQPVFLLPIRQVQKLLGEISSTFHIDVFVPPFPFTMSFFDDKTPQPTFLGVTRSRTEYEELQNKLVPPGQGHGECPEDASQSEMRAFQQFSAKCEAARSANKVDKAKKKEKKAKEKLVAFHKAASGLRRSQRYFGLRPRSDEIDAPIPSQSWDNRHVNKPNISLGTLDIAQKAPHAFEMDVVFIAFDVEANEHAHHLITEIGVSTLDTQDLHDRPPGAGGENWIQQIRSRHFRIKEHSYMKNSTFVSGDPGGFHFGTSEFVGLRNGEAVEAVDKCFSFPFSYGFQHDGKQSVPKLNQSVLQGPENRRVVLVGHDTQTDIDFLSTLGSKIFSSSTKTSHSDVTKHEALSRVEEALDIATLYRTLKSETQTRSLGAIMTDLGRDAWGLHNGGNDARYTLECLVGMVIKARVEDGIRAEKEAADKAELNRRLAETNRAWSAGPTICNVADPKPESKYKAQASNLTAAQKTEIERQIDETNREWAARDVEQGKHTNSSNTDNGISTPSTEIGKPATDKTSGQEPAAAAMVPDVSKLLDPTLTSKNACPLRPSRGRHYGSDNDEMDEMFDDHDDYDDRDLGQAAEAKLRLGDNSGHGGGGGGGDYESSDGEFEM